MRFRILAGAALVLGIAGLATSTGFTSHNRSSLSLVGGVL